MAKKRQYYDGVDKQNNADFTGHAFVTLNTEKGSRFDGNLIKKKNTFT